jgi:hypothetical protein
VLVVRGDVPSAGICRLAHASGSWRAGVAYKVPAP